jgi:large subunit ribosomal protein L22
MQARAQAKFVRSSSRKIRQILELIRDKNVDNAEDILRLTNRPIARKVQKVLKSAVSNAVDQDSDVEVEKLVVKSAVADPGPTLKRWLPRARGRATPLLKRTCHITVVVGDDR